MTQVPENPRSVVKKIMENNSQASHEEITRLFIKEMKKRKALLQSVAEYCVTKEIAALTRAPRAKRIDYEKWAEDVIAKYGLRSGQPLQRPDALREKDS